MSRHRRGDWAPGPHQPQVFYDFGKFMRSGYPSRYDNWPVIDTGHTTPPWQQRLSQIRRPRRSTR